VASNVSVQTPFRTQPQHQHQSRGRSETCLYNGLSKLHPLVLLLTLFLVAPASAVEITGRVVGQNGEGIAQAVVFVQAFPAGISLPSDKQFAVMDQVNKTFVPTVLPIVVGTEVYFPNHDQIHHHVYSFSRTKSFELPLYKGEEAPPVLFDKIGAVKIGCNIHDWMSGVILVLPTPYFATTDETGWFVLSALPPGTYSLACWHELSQAKVEETVQQVQVDGNAAAVSFTLSLTAPRPRPSIYGGRGYP
jgi:plastocyanin